MGVAGPGRTEAASEAGGQEGHPDAGNSRLPTPPVHPGDGEDQRTERTGKTEAGSRRGFTSPAQRAGASLTLRPDARGAGGEVCCREEPGQGQAGLDSSPGQESYYRMCRRVTRSRFKNTDTQRNTLCKPMKMSCGARNKEGTKIQDCSGTVGWESGMHGVRRFSLTGQRIKVPSAG